MMNWPKTLTEAIQKANDIEMARQAINFDRPQGQNTVPQRYHRGQGRRGSGRQNYIASVLAQEQIVNAGGVAQHQSAQNQCHRCHGYGHWAYQCPTLVGRGRRGGRCGRRGRGRGNRRGGGRGQDGRMAVLVLPEPAATGAALQSALVALSRTQLQQ